MPQEKILYGLSKEEMQDKVSDFFVQNADSVKVIEIKMNAHDVKIIYYKR